MLQRDTFDFNMGICLWDGAGLREAPGRSGKIKYITTVYFGEQVEILEENREVEGEKRLYMKIRLSDGQSGWVNQYLFAKNANLAVVTDRSEIYRRPDPMTFKNDAFERGEIVAVVSQKGDWIKLEGIERKKSGWIRHPDHLSNTHPDLRLALQYERALREKSTSKRREKLESILEDEVASRSDLKDVVRAYMREGEAR